MILLQQSVDPGEDPQAPPYPIRATGTIRYVADGLAHTGIPLVLVPAGTGNLLAQNRGPSHLRSRRYRGRPCRSIALSTAKQEESRRQAIDARTLIGQAQGHPHGTVRA
jgi:hypothetical protein